MTLAEPIHLSHVAAEEQDDGLRRVFFSDNGPDYLGGRGLITNSGPTGMFLNPTSGTMPHGSMAAQVFATVIKPLPNEDQFAWYNALVSYGLKDWLEIGALAQLVDRSNNVLTQGTIQRDNQSVMAGGAFIRLRILKDERFWPELSVGGITLEGNEILRRRTVFLAASKRFVLSEDGFFKAVRLHLGGRQFWQREGSALSFTTWSFLAQRGSEDHVGYAGGEIEFPRHVYLVGEVQTKETGNRYIPWSAGVQVRHPSGLGLSIAVLQPGFQSSLTGYIGIGINFM
jgi:hypothetical protein